MAIYLVPLARYDEAEEWAREALDLAREHHLDVKVASALQIHLKLSQLYDRTRRQSRKRRAHTLRGSSASSTAASQR